MSTISDALGSASKFIIVITVVICSKNLRRPLTNEIGGDNASQNMAYDIFFSQLSFCQFVCQVNTYFCHSKIGKPDLWHLNLIKGGNNEWYILELLNRIVILGKTSNQYYKTTQIQTQNKQIRSENQRKKDTNHHKTITQGSEPTNLIIKKNIYKPLNIRYRRKHQETTKEP